MIRSTDCTLTKQTVGRCGGELLQADRGEARHKVPVVLAVAVLRRPPWTPLLAVPNRIPLTQTLRLALEPMLTGELRAALRIPPETLLHLGYKMLEMACDRYSLRHRCKGPLQVGL